MKQLCWLFRCSRNAISIQVFCFIFMEKTKYFKKWFEAPAEYMNMSNNTMWRKLLFLLNNLFFYPYSAISMTISIETLNCGISDIFVLSRISNNFPTRKKNKKSREVNSHQSNYDCNYVTSSNYRDLNNNTNHLLVISHIHIHLYAQRKSIYEL